jgi:hypothetical protein
MTKGKAPRSTFRVWSHWDAWGRWVVAGTFIVCGVILTAPALQQLSRWQQVQNDRAIVWNEVSYPQGNVGTVAPDEVAPGDVISVTFKEFCNKGVDVQTERWVEFMAPNGKTPLVGYRLLTVEFYGSNYKALGLLPNEEGCFKNITQDIGIPAELVGRPPGDATVRIRFSLSYVKPEQVVRVSAFTETFTLLSESGQ